LTATIVALALPLFTACAPSRSSASEPRACESRVAAVENPNGIEYDVVYYYSSGHGTELLGVVDAGRTTTFRLPEASGGSVRAVRHDMRPIRLPPGTQMRKVSIRIQCATPQ
jgi:hypothetical protein